MRLLVLATGSTIVLATLSGGCAATVSGASPGPERVVVAVDAPAAHTSSEVVEITESVPPLVPEAAAPRRRLSQVVTLGQGTSEPVYATPAPQQGAGGGGPNVTVNNTVVVNGAPTGYGYGGYGYGGYGYGGYGRAGTGAGMSGRGDARSAGAQGAWAPSGWEGAQRTAAPGHTPGVGGNWSPPPSSGPRSMK